MAETAADVDPRLQDLEEEDERWAHEAPPVDYERIKRWVMQRDGKDYIQYLGLVDLLHQESGGSFRIRTKLEQAPTAENGMLAICSAEVDILDAKGHDIAPPLRSASGLGDASPGSVNRMMAPHLVRMAETRAKGRAIRDLLNVGMVTAEELGPDGPVKDEPRANYSAGASTDRNPSGNNGGTGRVHEQADIIDVDGKVYNRDQVWGFYQQRMNQMRDRKLTVPTNLLLTNKAPLKAIVSATQALRSAIERANAAAPAN